MNPDSFDSEAEMHRPRVALLGGGVHAVVVADCIRRCDTAVIAGYCDISGHEPSHMQRMNVPCLGDEISLLSHLPEHTVDAAILAMAGLEHVALRRRLVARLDPIVPQWWTAVHPTATVANSAQIGPGSVIFANATVNPLARIGAHCVVNTAAVIEHHVEMDDFAVVSPHATLCGCTKVGRGAFIGAGAVVVADIRVGPGAIVGAGAVVIRNVPENAVVVGNPARTLRPAERRPVAAE